MSLHTVSQLKDSVAGMLSGLDLNQVDDLNGCLERAASTLVQQADIPEASGIQNINLYNGVYDYPCDDTIFGTAITDIRPQGITRPVNDYVYKKPSETFDRVKGWLSNGTMTTFDFYNGEPIIRIESTLTIQKINIDQMSDTDGWVAAGSASGLTQDTAVYYHTPASLRFTLTGSSSGTLTKTLDNSISMASYENVGVAFLAIMIPTGATASALTSISLKLGSSSGNYDSVSNTDGFLGAWVAGEWLLVAFDFAGATSTGTPDWTAIDYVQVSFNHTSTFTNFRVGGLWISQPCPSQIRFQSAAIFKASGVPATTTITADTDTIILNNPAYVLYQYESAISVLMQTGASESSDALVTMQRKLHGNGNDLGLYSLFRGDNPSEELRQIGSYYDVGGDIGGYYNGRANY